MTAKMTSTELAADVLFDLELTDEPFGLTIRDVEMIAESLYNADLLVPETRDAAVDKAVEIIADVIPTFKPRTHAVTKAKLVVDELQKCGLLGYRDVEYETNSSTQWGVGTVNEQGTLTVVAAPSRDEAERMARSGESTIVRRSITKWEVLD